MTKTSSYKFSHDEKEAVYHVIHERRDMRHFSDGTVSPAVLSKILEAGHAAPSVGLMQPWRFVRITSVKLREQLIALVEEEKNKTADEMSQRKKEFMQLKVEGMRNCAELIVVVLAPDDGTVFGRRTMAEEMALCSTSCAIQNMWLAARVENLGMGWVSFFKPEDVAKLLACPAGAKPLALLCLGPVGEFYEQPMLEQEDWRYRTRLEKVFAENIYPSK